MWRNGDGIGGNQSAKQQRRQRNGGEMAKASAAGENLANARGASLRGAPARWRHHGGVIWRGAGGRIWQGVWRRK